MNQVSTSLKRSIGFLIVLSITIVIAGLKQLTIKPAKSEYIPEIVTGAEQTEKYLPLLLNKRVGMLVNQTAVINNKSIVDTLLALGIKIKSIFGPEHGFRSNASNGAKVADEIDTKTGIPIISLYGKKRKPSKEDMDSLDILVFDIQDVGCRFYTNINKLYDMMEACAENNKEL